MASSTDNTASKMAARDPRARLMVVDSAKILKRFYFLQRELVIMQAGWLPGTEHWQTKLLLPEFLWQDSLIARDLRGRVLEMRFPEREITAGDDAALLAVWRRFFDAPNPVVFAEGLLRVIKPLLRGAMREYLGLADPLDDGPTARILEQAVEDIDQQLDRWREAVDDAVGVYPEQRAAAEDWVRGLQSAAAPLADLLTRDTLPDPLPAFDPAAHGGRAFAISRTGRRDKRFDVMRFGWPDQLDPTRPPGEGLELQIRQASAHINEVWAAEMAAACLFDLADQADEEYLTNAARWCYDEIRHCRMGYTRFLHWGFTMDQMPIGSFSYDAGAAADPVTRLGIIFYFESTYIHTKWQRMRYFGEFGDPLSSHDMDFDWADEQIHAHYGARWLKYFLEKAGDPRKPMEFRIVAEEAIKAIRGSATPADREQTERAYQRTMQRARDLAC